MPIPLRLKLFSRSGAAFGEEKLVVLDTAATELRFEGVTDQPVLSINRGFSAPVIVETDRSAADLALLSAHDDDPVARYEALQQLMLDTLTAQVEAGTADFAPVVEAVRLTLGGEKVTGEERLLEGLRERIRDVRVGPDGALYLLTANSAGRILRVVPAK